MPRPPMLDPKRDLVGATPETLALALLGRKPSGSRPARKSVVRDKVAEHESATDKAGDGVTHLGEGV